MEEQKQEFQSKYKKSQRIFAIIGIALLLLLYIVTLISAIIATPVTKQLFTACIFGTFLIPLFIYGYIQLGKLLSGR